MKRRLLWPLAALVLAAAVAWLLWPARRPTFVWQEQVPRDADSWLWLDQPEAARRGLSSLTRSVPGLRGLPELLHLWAGIDLLDAEAVEEAGLRADAGFAAFAWRGSQWLVVPVLDDAGARRLRELLTARGWQVVATGPQSAQLRRVDQTEAGECWLESDRRWVLRLGPPLADARTAWTAAAKLPPSPPRPGVLHAHLKLAPTQLDAARQHLGLAAGLVGGLLDRLRTADVDLLFAGASPTLQVRLGSEPGQLADVAEYYQNFVPDDDGLLQLGEVLPDETALLVRGRLNPLLLQLGLSVLGGPGALTNVLAAWHPSLVGIDPARQLLAPWDGQWAVALLGVNDGVPLDPTQWTPAVVRGQLRWGIAGNFKSDRDAADLVARVRSAVETSGTVTTPAQVGAWTGWTVGDPAAPWTLLQNARRVMLVSGSGALDDLQRTSAGKFGTLAKQWLDEPERGLIQGRQHWWGALASTPRLVRALRRRGIPDDVVDMLGSVARVSTVARWTPDGLEWTLHLEPAGPP